MEQILLPLLSVVGGYRFSREWRGCNHEVAFENDQRIYLRAVLYGAALFLFVAAVIVVDRQSLQLATLVWQGKVGEITFGAEHMSLGEGERLICALATMFIGKHIARLLNDCPSFQEFYDAELSRHVKNNELAHLLYRAMRSASPVMLTLKNGKVYVGLINTGVSNAEKDQYISIIPIISGYRDEKHEVQYTTNYALAFQEVARKPTNRNRARGLTKVIPVAEIVSSNIYDARIDAAFRGATSVKSPGGHSAD